MSDAGRLAASLRTGLGTVIDRLNLPLWLLVLPLALWTIAFFVVPIGFLVRESVLTYRVTESGVYQITPDLTFSAWNETVFTSDFLRLWWTTVKIALIQTGIVLLVVFPYAYAVSFHGGSRRIQWTIIGFTMLPFFVSYVMQVYAWQPVLSNRGILHELSGGFLPALLRTPKGMHIGLLGYIWPLAALLMYVLGLNTINRRYLAAAANLGASPIHVFWDIVVRLSKPGIVMAAMLSFVLSFSDLLSAQSLGSVRTVASLLSDNQRLSGNTPAAAAVSVVMLLTILAVILFSFRVMGRVNLTGGEQGDMESYKSGPVASWFWRSYIVVGLFFISIPPIILTVYGFHGPKIPVWPIQFFSTHWYSVMYNDEGMIESLKNSGKVAVAVGFGATILGGLAAYYFARFRPRWVIPYTILVVAPAVAPPVVLSLGLLIYFVQIGIWGDLTSVVIAHIGLVGVFSLFIINNRLSQIDPRLEEAATNLGAGRLTAIRDVTIPLILPAIVASFVVAAGISFGESVVTLFLTATTYTWPAYTVNIVVQNTTPEIYAAAAVVYACLVVLLAVTFLLTTLTSNLRMPPPRLRGARVAISPGITEASGGPEKVTDDQA